MKKAWKRLAIVTLECVTKVLPYLTAWILLRLLH
jgi:hypothetical protein